MRDSIYTSGRFDSLTFVIVTLLFLSACMGVLYMPGQIAGGVRSGVDYSLSVLLPSLFPFMFLSAFSNEYGISARIGRLFSPITRAVLYLPGCTGVTVLMSLIGGFPVGAAGISSLLKQGRITNKQALRMLCYCVNPGPAFLISAVGNDLLGSKRAGVLLFAAQTAASILVGAILGLIARFREPLEQEKAEVGRVHDFSSAFVLSAKDACSAAVSLCSLVVLFSAFSGLLLYALDLEDGTVGSAALRSLLEVTDGTAQLAAMRSPLWFTALAVGWGGFCVHLQIFAALPGLRINKTLFALSRLLVGAMSGALVYAFLTLTKADAAAFAPIKETTVHFSSLTFYGSAALFVSSVLFLIFLRKESENIINHASA